MSEKIKLHIDNYDAVSEAVMNCLQDMYAIAQPPLDFRAYCEEVKKNPELQKVTIWDKHYIPHKIHEEIMDMYLHKYHLEDTWQNHAQMCIDYLKDGGTKDKYIDEHTDEHGNWHPGYRGYEKVTPLDTVIGKEMTDIVLKRLQWCKDFYVGNRYECSFRFNVCDLSPSSNAKSVTEKQHELGNTDFVIDEDFDPWKEDDDLDNEVVEE